MNLGIKAAVFFSLLVSCGRAVSWSVGTLAAAAFGREINVRGLENQAYDKNLTRWSAAVHLIIEHKLGFGKQRDTIDLSIGPFFRKPTCQYNTAASLYYVHVSVSLLSNSAGRIDVAQPPEPKRPDVMLTLTRTTRV